MKYFWPYVLFVVLLLISVGHCATSAPPKDSSLGALIYQDNPNQYLMGVIVKGDIVKDGKRLITVLEIAPTNTYDLFSEVVPFCGNQAEMINGHRRVVVFTYSKIMHQKDCFDLYRVDDLK